MNTFFDLPRGLFASEDDPAFSDGQPHICINLEVADRARQRRDIWLHCRIASPLDLIHVGQAVDVLKHNGYSVSLQINYLMGGRMDRRLSKAEPYTLRVICDIINSFGLKSVKVFVPHSQATSDLLNSYVDMPDVYEDCFYDVGIMRCVAAMLPEEGYEAGKLDENEKLAIRSMSGLSLVFPDAGAGKRFSKSNLIPWYSNASFVTLHKDRDERTGKILGTGIISGAPDRACVILDDLCDGGMTFKVSAEVLRAAGATKIGLVVPHGIFSKGTKIDGIDFIYTSNSFKDHESHESLYCKKL